MFGNFEVFQEGEGGKTKLQDIGASPGFAAGIAAEEIKQHVMITDSTLGIREDAFQGGAKPYKDGSVFGGVFL